MVVKICEQKMVLRMLSQRGFFTKIETMAKIESKEYNFFRLIPTGLQGFDL